MDYMWVSKVGVHQGLNSGRRIHSLSRHSLPIVEALIDGEVR